MTRIQLDNFHGTNPLTAEEREQLTQLKGALWQFMQLRAPAPGVALLALIHVMCNILLHMIPEAQHQGRVNWIVRMLPFYLSAYKSGELRVPR